MKTPFLVTWSSAKDMYIPTLSNIYLPFFYLEKVKRVEENYTFKVILWDDLPILWLAFSWQANHPLIDGLGIVMLLISFWCVYEIGYYENDYVAEKYEQQPRLSATYYLHKQMMQTTYPWVWSLISGFLGVALIEKAQSINLLFCPPFVEPETAFNSLTLPFLYWVAFLVSARLCFWVYNHLNKHTRTWLYLLLQSFRYYGFLAITATNSVGTGILSAQILSRSILYVVYRYSGGNADSWPKEVPVKLLRCLIFIFLLGAIALGTHSLELWQTWQTWAIILWCLVQGNKQIRVMLSEVKPVFKDGSNDVRTATP